jgi:hypothetical protein
VRGYTRRTAVFLQVAYNFINYALPHHLVCGDYVNTARAENLKLRLHHVSVV